jgi:hypothetical protein
MFNIKNEVNLLNFSLVMGADTIHYYTSLNFKWLVMVIIWEIGIGINYHLYCHV